MKVLVTGSEGRVGRWVTSILRARGHRVRGLDVAPAREPALADEAVTGDFADAAVAAAAVDGVDAIVHLAGRMIWAKSEAGTWYQNDERTLFRANVDGTFTLLRAAAERPLARFVFASSGEVYPERAALYQPVDEQHPILTTSVYGLTKVLGETMVRHFGRSGLPFAIARFANTQSGEELLDPGNVFCGPRFYLRAKLAQLRTLAPDTAVRDSIAALEAYDDGADKVVASTSPTGTPYRMGICDPRDVAQGVALLLEHPAAAGETFNIGPSASVSFDALARRLAEATGLEAVTVALHTEPYAYDTSIAKAQAWLGYEPEHDVFAMIDEARERSLRGRPENMTP